MKKSKINSYSAMLKKTIAFLGVMVYFATMTNAKAQDTISEKYGNDSVNCVMNNSLYFEFFKQWRDSDYKSPAWKDAVRPWRWVFLNCPQSTRNIYLHGERLVDELIQNETDKTKRNKYVDTLMMVYDKRIEYFGNEGFVLGKRGSELYKLRPEAYEEAYANLTRSIELEGNESNGAVLIYLFRAAEKIVKSDKADRSLLFEVYDQASEIIDYNINRFRNEADEKKVTSWENVRGNLELSIEPYATCPDIISIYSVKFNNEPNNVDLLKKITKLLDRKNCTDSDLFLAATENLHRLEPSAKSAELMGKMNIRRENYTESVKFLQEAVQLHEDAQAKADVYFLLAHVYFQMKLYTQSRSAGNEVLKVRPNDGKIYILIGDLYASSAKDCGDNDLTSKVAYWAAVDKYVRARNVDPSVEDLARTKINTFSQYFPAKETIFFYDLDEGDAYTVECWINETTTVRASN